MAAAAGTLEGKRDTAYFELETLRYLTRCSSERVPFHWTINPYRGCEFGCKYCYARYTHEFMELRDAGEFEHKIFAKAFDPARFRQEAKKLPVGETVAIGTATDPYQPAERRFEVTRRMLQELAQLQGLRLWITTKSDLVTRDTNLLVELSRRHYMTVSMTITTADADLARLLEPLAPRPDLRLAAVRSLTDAGVRTVVGCSPVLPLINDAEVALDALAAAAKQNGAAGFGANVLFLQPSAKAVFLPFLEEHFPALLRRYRERFDNSAYLRGAYPETIRERVARIRLRHWPLAPAQPEPERWPVEKQMQLFV